MDTRTFAATLLKVAGLVICLFTLTKIPAYFPVPTLGEFPPDLYSRLVIAALNVVPPLLLGLALWFFPGRVANKIIFGADNPTPVAVASIERVAVMVLGLDLIAWGISDLAYQAGVFFRLDEHRSAVVPGALAAIAEIAIGGILAMGARRVISVLRGEREG